MRFKNLYRCKTKPTLMHFWNSSKHFPPSFQRSKQPFSFTFHKSGLENTRRDKFCLSKHVGEEAQFVFFHKSQQREGCICDPRAIPRHRGLLMLARFINAGAGT